MNRKAQRSHRAAKRAPSTNSAAQQAAPPPELLPPDDAGQRSDGWTRTRQAAFLYGLAAGDSVSDAAKAVGMSRQSAYRLRGRLKGEPFDLAWGAASQSYFDTLAEAALERAVHGVEVPHYHQGELIGTSRRYDERLTLSLLAMRKGLLPAPLPRWHRASAFRADDASGLIQRVESGPARWNDEHCIEEFDSQDESDDDSGDERC